MNYKPTAIFCESLLTDRVLVAANNAKAELDWMTLQAKVRTSFRFGLLERHLDSLKFLRQIDTLRSELSALFQEIS